MSTNWRISSFNGALLAAYFIPTWTIVAFKIMISPIHGLYERPNISVALFISDHLQLAAMTTVRVAWLLALGKLTVVAFFRDLHRIHCPRFDPQDRRLRRSAGHGAGDWQPDQFCKHGDGLAGGRDPSPQAACDRTPVAARHGDRVASRASRSGFAADRSRNDVRRSSP